MTLVVSPATPDPAALPARYLLSTAAIRERCGNVAAAASAGESIHFRIDRTRLAAAATLVADVTRSRYPDLAIPYHSRWRHFEAEGVDRRAELEHALGGCSTAQRARAHLDLAVVSVLLDAGAGPTWRYDEQDSGKKFTRSEGLGVASFRAFMQGAFSVTPGDPLRVDGRALEVLDVGRLAAIFQAGGANPLVGLEGRVALLRRLGAAVSGRQDVFAGTARPGGLFDTLTQGGTRTAITATAILHALLDGLGSIWLTPSTLDGIALGDTWRHPHAAGTGPSAGWVPFHKLSQWLSYSLFEPFEWAGISVTDRDELTGLPEYRNGGLLLDTGVLALVDDGAALVPWDVGDELVVEWRALTVALLDELAPLVRIRLGAPDLPLACILEGGTWAAGRKLAAALRGGNPPLNVRSDGTVF